VKQLYLHIETIPSQIHAVREAIFAKAKYQTPGDIPEIKPAANLKDPAKIEADIARRVEKAILDLRALRIKNAADAEAEFRGLAADGYSLTSPSSPMRSTGIPSKSFRRSPSSARWCLIVPVI
jgi:hypothetical protein